MEGTAQAEMMMDVWTRGLLQSVIYSRPAGVKTTALEHMYCRFTTRVLSKNKVIERIEYMKRGSKYLRQGKCYSILTLRKALNPRAIPRYLSIMSCKCNEIAWHFSSRPTSIFFLGDPI